MRRKPFRVGRSNTGLGLFATDTIEKGEFIVEYKGRWLRNPEADAMADRGCKYLYEINSRWTIDGSPRSNVARYANHSCRPNAESDVTRDRRVVITAIKKIKPGEEITYDYGKDYFNLIIKPMGCRCAKCVEKRREERRLKRLAAKRARARREKAAAKAAALAKTNGFKTNGAKPAHRREKSRTPAAAKRTPPVIARRAKLDEAISV
jgi:SET domain-containing protein